MSHQAKSRTPWQWLADAQWSRYARLPARTSSYTLSRDVRIPMRELVTAVIACAPHDFGGFVYTGRAFLLSTMFEWSFATSKQAEPLLPRIVSVLSSRGRVQKALAALPLIEAGDELVDGKAPWYREWVSRRDLNDPWWKRGDLTDALDWVRVPVLLQTGWQDGFLRPTFAGYHRLADHGVDVGLTVGPGRFPRPPPHRAGQVFVSGSSEGWRDLPAWPPATIEQILHPRSGERLAAQPASPGEVREFTYDPANPTPTYGGAFVTQISPGFTSGYTDDSALASRPDVLAFTSDPLTAPLEVTGSPVVEVGHSSDNPFAELFVRLSDVQADGRSRNVSDGFVRPDPRQPSDVIRVELDPVAHRFTPGSRIRLIIAGGSHPRWERNLGTDDDPATSARMQPSHRTIDLPATRAILPGRPPARRITTPSTPRRSDRARARCRCSTSS